jgi:putative ABC transport system substrate-binding protein
VEDPFHQVGVYVGRILTGTKPMQPTKFQLVLNFNTAKALGLDNRQKFSRSRTR